MTEAKRNGAVAIYPLRYTAAELHSVPEDDAVFFLMCGQLQNDLVVLMRQLLQARIVEGDAEPLRLAAATAAMLNMRMLAARLTEGWNLIKDRFQGVFLSYGNAIGPDAKADLVWLKTYFSKSNLVRDIRNKAGAHFDREVATDAFRNLSPEEPMIDLHAHEEGNTIYFSGEALMLASLIELSPHDDVAIALDGLADEILTVARRVGNVVRAYLKGFSERHLSAQLDGLSGERIVVGDQPHLDAFAAPLYLARARSSDLARRLLSGASPRAINWFKGE